MLLSLFLCFALPAQTQLQNAVALTRAGQYEKARAELAHVPEPMETPQRIAFHRLKAAIASGLGDGAGAAGEMEAALALAPSDPALLTGTAMAEQQIGRLDQALSLAQEAGENAPAKAIIGDIQEKYGQFQEAVAAYREAIRLDPSREQFRVALGLELTRHGAFDQAAKGLRESAALFPKSAILLTLLAIAVYAAGEGKEAEQTLDNAIRVDPQYTPAYRCLAKIVLESSTVPSQKTVAALCEWNHIVCSALRLRVTRESGDEKLREQAMVDLTHASKSDAVSRCALGQAYDWMSQTGKARAEMESCVALDPSPQNHYRLGLLYRKLGETALAQKQFEARKKLLQKMSEETVAGLSALQALEQSGR